jgi:broad-specificity NMP kinase
MFNVCPRCGQYSEEKEIRKGPLRSVCASCGHEREFLELPLFVVTGASGTGKTTAALELLGSTTDFIVLDQDILWNDAFNAPSNDYRLFRNTWLRVAKNIHQSGRSVVLFGTAIPEQYESCPERRYLSQIHYLALVCRPAELELRLRDRPEWRKSGTEENLKRMLDFNKWLQENAATTEPIMQTLDTTATSVQNTVKSIRDWIADRLKATSTLREPT